MTRSGVRLVERKEIVGYLPFNPPVPIAEPRYELQSVAALPRDTSRSYVANAASRSRSASTFNTRMFLFSRGAAS
jgi:hypothetical protein